MDVLSVAGRRLAGGAVRRAGARDGWRRSHRTHAGVHAESDQGGQAPYELAAGTPGLRARGRRVRRARLEGAGLATFPRVVRPVRAAHLVVRDAWLARTGR